MTASNITTQELLTIDHIKLAENSESYKQLWLSRWMTIMETCDEEDFQQINHINDCIEQLGKLELEAIWSLNNRLKHPMQKMMNDSAGGGQVTILLKELQRYVEHIKPPQKSFFSGLKNLFKLLFSWSESAWQIWLESYPENKKNIDNSIKQLKSIDRQLNRDNHMLSVDRQDLNSCIEQLQNCYDLVSELANTSQTNWHEKLDSSENSLMPIKEFLPSFQERVIDIQQQLLIARQTVMTLELFITQNKTQLKGIKKAVNTTEQVLNVTASLAMLEKGQNNLRKLERNHKRLSDPVDNLKLKQARHVIDKAMSQINTLQHQSESVEKQTPLEKPSR